MNIMYVARAKANAGREGRADSDDGLLSVKLALPTALGGKGDGTNPEQLFAAGYAACFHSALLFIGGQQKLNLADSSVSAEVAIGQAPDQAGFQLAADLQVDLPNLPQAEAEALVAQAHTVCPYSNAVRGNITVGIVTRGMVS